MKSGLTGNPNATRAVAIAMVDAVQIALSSSVLTDATPQTVKAADGRRRTERTPCSWTAITKPAPRHEHRHAGQQAPGPKPRNGQGCQV